MIIETESRSTIALWRAVIAQTLDDATVFASNSRKRVMISQARSWLLTPNRDFIEVCALADVEPTQVRALARKRIADSDARLAEKEAAYMKHVKARAKGVARQKMGRGVVKDFPNNASDRHSPAAQETT